MISSHYLRAIWLRIHAGITYTCWDQIYYMFSKGGP